MDTMSTFIKDAKKVLKVREHFRGKTRDGFSVKFVRLSSVKKVWKIEKLGKKFGLKIVKVLPKEGTSWWAGVRVYFKHSAKLAA